MTETKRPPRCCLYSIDHPEGKIFEGADAISAAEEDGWVDSPAKVKAREPIGVMSNIKRWWQGTQEAKIVNIRGRRVIVRQEKEWHWTAKLVRALVSFYLSHWQWLWVYLVSLVYLFHKFDIL